MPDVILTFSRVFLQSGKLRTHLLNHTVRGAASSGQWREPDGRRLQRSQAATQGSSSTWTWAEFWPAPAPSGEFINKKRIVNIHVHITWVAVTLEQCRYLSRVASHLNELSGYYLHHLPHLLMIGKINVTPGNHEAHQTNQQEMSTLLSRACNHLSGVCTGMDTQQTTVLVAVMIRGGIVHPMMPKEYQQNTQKIWMYFILKMTDIQLMLCRAWYLLSTFRYRRVNMPFPGPPAEKDPPPPIIMFSTAKGMKSSSFQDKIHISTHLHQGAV